jgi:hypothetical protein
MQLPHRTLEPWAFLRMSYKILSMVRHNFSPHPHKSLSHVLFLEFVQECNTDGFKVKQQTIKKGAASTVKVGVAAVLISVVTVISLL